MQVSVVGFGSLSIGLANTEQQRVTRLLNQALDGGLNMIDAAECYGHPDKNHAEMFIGNAVWRFPARPEWEWYAEYWDLIESLDYPFFKGAALTDPGPEGASGMALRFVTSTPGVHSAIVGTTSPGRWTQNNGNISTEPLSADQYRAIRANWRALPSEKRELG